MRILRRLWSWVLIVISLAIIAAPTWIPLAGSLGLIDTRPLAAAVGFAIMGIWVVWLLGIATAALFEWIAGLCHR